MKKPDLIDELFLLQESYDFDIVWTVDHKYMLIPHAIHS